MYLIEAGLNRFPKQTRTIIVTLLVGLGAGLLTVLFQVAMNGVFAASLEPLSRRDSVTFIAGSFVCVVGTGLVAGWLMNAFGRETAGSGIPQLKVAFWKDFGFVPARVIWVKFVAAVLQIGGGSSLGREGPSVQLAGAVGSNLAGLTGSPKQKRQLGAAAGAAAGLAAAFNTPLAAVTFVLEELIGDLNSRLLGSVLLAGVVGALVTHGILGPQPAFALNLVQEPSLQVYLLIPVVATVAAYAGVWFQKNALSFRARVSGWREIPAALRPGIGALICWVLGVVVFLATGKLGVFGLGYEDLSDALAGHLEWRISLLLLLTKLVATVCCYGAGGCGGIFAPTLFFGAMVGATIDGLMDLALPGISEDGTLLAVVGMSATLGVVVRAPVTSILIVFEMTHQFALLPPLMVTALVSQAVSRTYLKHNFYDALLEQDGHQLERFAPPRDLRDFQEQPVSVLANPRPIVVTDLGSSAVKKVLERHPYDRFPVVESGELKGVLSRAKAVEALRSGGVIPLDSAVVCAAETSVREASLRMVEADSVMIVVVGEGQVTGVMTLHDLLRAQQSAADAIAAHSA